jgi:hydroxymethylbilane synthase
VVPEATIRIATRGSDLALWQVRWVGARLAALGARSELVLVETSGDRSQAPIPSLGVGVFTKAVQEALLRDEADVAVHSYKDLPSRPADGLEVAAVPPRAAAHEVLLIRRERHDPTAGPLPLAAGASVGTGAVRRRALLAALRPDVRSVPLRGNVPTRVARLGAGDLDALVLAAAGLERLGLDLGELIRVDLDPTVFVPAPAQGALALEVRRDHPLADLLTDLHDVAGYPPVAAERGLMAHLQAGCQLALGAFAWRDGAALAMTAWFDGHAARVRHPHPEGLAMLAYQALAQARAAGVA